MQFLLSKMWYMWKRCLRIDICELNFFPQILLFFEILNSFLSQYCRILNNAAERFLKFYISLDQFYKTKQKTHKNGQLTIYDGF